MEVGALHIFHKPQTAKDFKLTFEKLKDQLADIAKVNVKAAPRKKVTVPEPKAPMVLSQTETTFSSNKIILIGSSTGGVQALSTILPKFPKNSPPILIVQHMPEGFTTGFAKRMDKMCPMIVSEARSGEIVEGGHIYIAPGGEQHMIVILKGNRLAISIKQHDKVNGHRPSVDVLFNSFTSIRKFHPLVAVLTGMGADGAEGMKALAKYTNDLVTQSQSTCVVYGMPMVAKQLNPKAKSVDLKDIPDVLIKMASK